MLNPKNFYLPQKEAIITEKRFTDLFHINRRSPFFLMSTLSNIQRVDWNTGKYCPELYGMTEFLEQGDDGHGGKCMHRVFRTQNYNELVDYLFSIGEEWRFER